LQTDAGYTAREARALKLSDVDGLFDYWSRNPPPSSLIRFIAMVLGWQPPEEPAPYKTIDEAFAANADLILAAERQFGIIVTE
jgi:hypothetical protein